jgi:hypothetical protein
VAKGLRSLKLIVAELALIALASVTLTLLPQVTSDPEGARRMLESASWAAPVLRFLQVDHILGAWWFLALLLVSLESLGVVVTDQWRRFWPQWCERLAPASFRQAPFRREWTRPLTGAGASVKIRSHGKLGLLGLPLFHTGLVLVVLAGLLRMLFATDAVVDLHEGETLPPSPAAYGAQWPGRFAAPFTLDAPLVLDRVVPAHYDNGLLKGLSAQVRLDGGTQPVQVAINAPLRFGSRQFFLSQLYGPAAFLQVASGGRSEKAAAFLRREAGSSHSLAVPIQGREVRLRGALGSNGELPQDLDVRVLQSGALLMTGPLRVGEPMNLPDGTVITLVDLRYWAQFTASRDAFLPIAYLGFVLAIAGAACLFLLVRVDTAIGVEPGPDGERIWAALRARRFTPLYAERFERLVRDNGGPGEPKT